MVRGSIIAFLVAAVILEYISYKMRNIIDYFRNPLTIVMGAADSLKIEDLPSNEREQLIFLKKTLDNMERTYNELTWGVKMVKVLIAEDYLELLDFYKISLDYELFLAKDGEEALEMFKKHRPDIVLMDIKLPKKDGLEVTREILSIDPDARVIAITAYGYLGPKALEVGAKEVIRKPFKMSELNELINKYAKK